MKHNKYILALAFASMLTLGSCGDDFLGKEPQGVLTPEALANAQGVELLVTSAYAGLASPVKGYDPYQASPFNWVWGGIYGGDANKGSDPNDQSTGYSGLDPEYTNADMGKESGGDLQRGVDMGGWPSTMRFLFGVNFAF